MLGRLSLLAVLLFALVGPVQVAGYGFEDGTTGQSYVDTSRWGVVHLVS